MTQVTEMQDMKPQIDKFGRSYGTGRRKSAKARVWVKPGKGKFIVNGKTIEQYFARSTSRDIINQAFDATNTHGEFDIFCTVSGGGLSGQAGAVRHGLSRALAHYNPNSYRKLLRETGLLTRDSRVVERKKFGKKKARKRFQFSKR